jgi:hypothetical protein
MTGLLTRFPVTTTVSLAPISPPAHTFLMLHVVWPALQQKRTGYCPLGKPSPLTATLAEAILPLNVAYAVAVRSLHGAAHGAAMVI